jgi:predicted PurR-regulated permease PerM
MNFNRPIIFWIATLAGIVAIVILLRGVLLPFVTGMALAYLLSPVAGRMERLGISRLLATLAIMGIVVVTIIALMALMLPTIVREISYFVENLPLYVRKLHSLATDPDWPWLSKIIGDGLGEAERSVSELTTLASSSLDVFLRSLWSGGAALISFFSLAIVAPIVACYLIYDWDRMIATLDRWIPPARRETVWRSPRRSTRPSVVSCVVRFYSVSFWPCSMHWRSR